MSGGEMSGEDKPEDCAKAGIVVMENRIAVERAGLRLGRFTKNLLRMFEISLIDCLDNFVV